MFRLLPCHRHTDCQVRIQLPHVSTHHTRLTVDENDGVWIENLSEINHTVVNTVAIQERLKLKHGDIFMISDRSFRYEAPTATLATKVSCD